jgi:gluconate 2-dehydrogenase gamma chain
MYTITPVDLSRRHWILGCVGSGVFAGLADAHEHARQALASAGADGFEFFDSSTAAEVAAIAARILPSDDGPGATEAGAIYFIDHALTTFEQDKRDAYRTGMADIQKVRSELFPNSTSIAGLPNELQIDLLRAVEHTEFFELLRLHTVLGFLGDPKYGGNRNQAGWKHIGFEDTMAFQPPFGYYDVEGK